MNVDLEGQGPDICEQLVDDSILGVVVGGLRGMWMDDVPPPEDPSAQTA